jgi:hypothetical protein
VDATSAITFIAILVVGLAVIGGIAFVATRWSLGRYAEHRRVVAQSDAALERLARELALEFLPRGGYDHPLVGHIPAFSLVRGTVNGVPVRVEVESEGDEPVTFRTVLSASIEGTLADPLPESAGYRLRRDGSRIALLPMVDKTGSVHAFVYHVVTDADLLRGLLSELASIASRR